MAVTPLLWLYEVCLNPFLKPIKYMDEQSQQLRRLLGATGTLHLHQYIWAWVNQNSLLLNTLKCCYLLFSRKPTPTLPSSPLLVNNIVLYMAKEFKYLGVTFSLDASWTPHINTICLKTRNLLVCSSRNSTATLTHIHS